MLHDLVESIQDNLSLWITPLDLVYKLQESALFASIRLIPISNRFVWILLQLNLNRLPKALSKIDQDLQVPLVNLTDPLALNLLAVNLFLASTLDSIFHSFSNSQIYSFLAVPPIHLIH